MAVKKKKATKKKVAKKKVIKKKVIKKKAAKKNDSKEGVGKSVQDQENSNRKTWIENNIKLEEAYEDLLTTTKQMPTLLDLAKKSGLNRNTVSKHLKKWDYYKNVQESKLKLLIPLLLERAGRQLYAKPNMPDIEKFIESVMKVKEQFGGKDEKTQFYIVGGKRIDF